MTRRQHDHNLWTGESRLNRRAIPNIQVTDQHGQNYRFYEDLVCGKTILLSFTSIAHDLELPVTAKVAEVCQKLDAMNESQTSVYTITVDPMRDHPALLKKFASLYRPSKRWQFLTGKAADLALLRSAFFVERGVPSIGAGEQLLRRLDVLCLAPGQAKADCSMGLLRYGNEAIDLWAAVPVTASVDAIAMRLSWICENDCRPTSRRRGRRTTNIA